MGFDAQSFFLLCIEKDYQGKLNAGVNLWSATNPLLLPLTLRRSTLALFVATSSSTLHKTRTLGRITRH